MSNWGGPCGKCAIIFRMQRVYYVDAPVTDLLSEPEFSKIESFSEKNRLSQLLYNEEVEILAEKKGWFLVEALEQRSFRQRGFWAPYRGYAKKEHLRESERRLHFNAVVISPKILVEEEDFKIPIPFGSRLILEEFPQSTSLTIDGKRKVHVREGTYRFLQKLETSGDEIVKTANIFIGCPYLWGGRSIKCEEVEAFGTLTGVDCSGLVNLVFRVNGIDLPRDAHDQFLFSKRIRGAELRAGDLIFLSTGKNPQMIDHVMIYCGDGNFVEASSREKKVRIGNLKDSFDLQISEIEEKAVRKGDLILFFGRVLEKDEPNKRDRDKEGLPTP